MMYNIKDFLRSITTTSSVLITWYQRNQYKASNKKQFFEIIKIALSNCMQIEMAVKQI